jgi:hypothetical protein
VTGDWRGKSDDGGGACLAERVNVLGIETVEKVGHGATQLVSSPYMFG